MKKSTKVLIFSYLFGILSFFATSCGGNKASDTAGKEYTSTYVCPMHCTGSGSAEMGTCPVCGMDYVLRTEHEKDGHKH